MLFVWDSSLLSRELDWGWVMMLCLINEPVCYLRPVAPRCQQCWTLMPLWIPLVTHCQFSWINTQLLLLGCSWHRVIIWTACRSLGSIRYHPHSFFLSFQLPLTLSSWPCSCFWGIFLLFPSFSIWSECLSILPGWRGYAMLISHPLNL